MFDRKISILIPYKSDGEYRDRNLSWAKKRYEALMPNAELCIGTCDTEPFCKSLAVNNAAKLATRDIFIIADVDLTFDLKQIAKAILELTSSIWIIPYTTLNYLTLEQTETLQQMKPSVAIGNINFTAYKERNCKFIYGGINIVPRKHFEKVGGFDERFKGWGYEDDAFQRSLDALCGPHKRIKTALWHMYHPPAPKSNHQKNKDLLNKFYGSKDSIIHYFSEKKSNLLNKN